MKSISFLLSFSFLSYLHSQKAYTFPEKFNPIYNFKPEVSKKNILTETLSGTKRDLAEDFVVNYVYNEQFMFDDNEVCMDWPEMEVYVLKILNTLFPDKEDSKRLDVFIRREINRGASVSRFGNIYINLGLLASTENEAAIAATIAHEAGHYFLNHYNKQLGPFDISKYPHERNEIKRSEYYEYQADSFALMRLSEAKYDLNAILNRQALEELNYRYYENLIEKATLAGNVIYDRDTIILKRDTIVSATDSSIAHKYTIVNNSLKNKAFHPYGDLSYSDETFNQFVKELNKCTACTSEYIVDSTFFVKLKRVTKEETMKLVFENSNWDLSTSICFNRYLKDAKNLKNLYYIIESLRRFLYSNPDQAKRGFLTAHIRDDSLFSYNLSILHKPRFINADGFDYDSLINHKLIKSRIKPFESYEQAFYYFTSEALKLNLNEANFSRALYSFGKQEPDSVKMFLEAYLKVGSGINLDYAKELLSNGKPRIKKGKTLIVYDNLANFTKGDFNYYLAKEKKVYNNIRSNLQKDTSKTTLIILNELLGDQPNKLHQIQKFKRALLTLYNEDDIQMCRKVRLNSNFPGEDKVIPFKFRKYLLIYAPEWYSWLNENNYDKLFLVNVSYKYDELMETKEVANSYSALYLDMNADRPYFKAHRSVKLSVRKTEDEIQKDISSFLYD